MKKVLVSHPFGNANTRALLEGFADHDILYKYITSVAIFKTSWWYKITGFSIFKIIRKRLYSETLRGKIKCFPLKEMCRQIAIRLNMYELISNENAVLSPFNCCCHIDKMAKKYLKKKSSAIEAVYCYEDTGLETFREAKKLGKICIYDLPAAYWRHKQILLDQERKKNPDWAVTLGTVEDSEKRLKREEEELLLADKIYVASTFTKKTLELFPSKLCDIEIIPYGFPPINKSRKHENIRGKIKLLYVGSLSQKKGLSYLLEAVEGLENLFNLTIIGSGRRDMCPSLDKALNKHNYLGILPHEKVLQAMSEHDVFVFPSISEGFGLVLTEAMSQGTPCIATDHTCAPDILQNGKDGWIVEAGSTSAIREKLLYLSEHKEEIVSAGKEAMRTAAKRSWKCYEDEISLSIQKTLKQLNSNEKY